MSRWLQDTRNLWLILGSAYGLIGLCASPLGPHNIGPVLGEVVGAAGIGAFVGYMASWEEGRGPKPAPK